MTKRNMTPQAFDAAVSEIHSQASAAMAAHFAGERIIPAWRPGRLDGGDVASAIQVYRCLHTHSEPIGASETGTIQLCFADADRRLVLLGNRTAASGEGRGAYVTVAVFEASALQQAVRRAVYAIERIEDLAIRDGIYEDISGPETRAFEPRRRRPGRP